MLTLVRVYQEKPLVQILFLAIAHCLDDQVDILRIVVRHAEAVFGPINRSTRTQWERTCSSDECTWQSQLSVGCAPAHHRFAEFRTAPTEFGKGGCAPRN